MDFRALPPLAALRAFAAFAEARGITEAGAALGVSHAAVSQQLRNLEEHLGLALLDRSGRALALTEAGEALARACLQGFGKIESEIRALTGASDARPLHVTTTPTFAAAWLMPRLAAFQQAHPAQQLLINPTPYNLALEPGGVDLALRYGRPPFAPLEATPLLISPMVVVAAPSLLEGLTDRGPDALAGLPWLEEFGTTEATRWLSRQGTARVPRAGFTQLPGNLLLEGLRAGQGVGVSVRAFVQADLDAGRLVQIHEDRARGAGYFIVHAPGPMRPALRTFVRWLKAQRPDPASG